MLTITIYQLQIILQIFPYPKYKLLGWMQWLLMLSFRYELKDFTLIYVYNIFLLIGVINAVS